MSGQRNIGSIVAGVYDDAEQRRAAAEQQESTHCAQVKRLASAAKASVENQPEAADPNREATDEVHGTDWKLAVMSAAADVDLASDRLVSAEEAVEAAKGAVKVARSELALAIQELRDRVSGRGQQKLPFGAQSSGAASGASPPGLTLHRSDAEAWRYFRVDDAQFGLLGCGLPQSICEVLNEQGVVTVGDIAAWTEKRPLTELQQIGPAKAEAIERALDAFFAWWKERQEVEVPAAAIEPGREE